MRDAELLGLLSTDHPVGLGGCRSGGNPLGPCEYNVTVFDGSKKPDEVMIAEGAAVRASHGSLDDLGSDTLVHYHGMRVLQDPSWELRMLLSRVAERRDAIFRDHAKNCLLDSIFCAARARDGIDSDVFAPCWAKSSLVYLAYSVLALNLQRPTPAHCLDRLRNLAKNAASDRVSAISDRMGMERATPSLLERMCRSTMGLSDETERNGHSKIIRAKTDHFIENSMLADCYMYLACVNHANFVSMRDSVHRRPDLIHILRVAYDLENDREKLRRDIETVRRASDSVLQNL